MRVIWPDTGNVETFDTQADAIARVAELRKRGYHVAQDRSGDFVVC